MMLADGSRFSTCIGKYSRRAVIVLLGCWLYVSPGLAQDDSVDLEAGPAVALVEADESSEAGGTAVEIATGCAAGAVAGSVLPGLGNLVGCAVGGLGAWVYRWF